ncbi:ATP-binding protein [Actinomadura sp. WMMB 499]|uniref:ATP-binding protein n=1 Tax=Actinomadura sp. WMMB 499 TaxID=1219491 RepID=UPI001247C65D|nr:ATP-binding protein [Actinomadura sp. WMMB 499]QFG25524.1 ATP-binding protein [Actinomadura sp. WMMB 499]
MVEATHAEMVVKRHLGSVAEVRGFVRLVLGTTDVDDFVPCLVASELVTNSIRHTTGTDDVTFRIGWNEDRSLWMEVQDSLWEEPRVQRADLDAESGRGMFVVESYTRYWGVRPLSGNLGKVVFAVLDP